MRVNRSAVLRPGESIGRADGAAHGVGTDRAGSYLNGLTTTRAVESAKRMTRQVGVDEGKARRVVA